MKKSDVQFHTPTPWKFVETDWTIRAMNFENNPFMGDYQGCILASFERAVGHGPDETSRSFALPEMRANAAHIIRCVNEREELLSIFRAINKWPHSWRQDGMLPIFERVRTVLARAE